MPTCENCEAHVTPDFRRVFGDPNTGAVHGCPRCMTNTEILNGETVEQ
jgi:hypothetical protein